MTDFEYVTGVLQDADVDHYTFWDSLNYCISIKDEIVLSFDDLDYLAAIKIGSIVYQTNRIEKKIAVDPFGVEEIKAIVAKNYKEKHE